MQIGTTKPRVRKFKSRMLLGAWAGLACALATSAHAQTSQPGPSDCAALVGQQVETGVVTAAERFEQGSLMIAANFSVAALAFGGDSAATTSTNLCRVQLQLRPTTSSVINVEVWLPETWNGKMFGYGGGGLNGGLGSRMPAMNTAAGRGYASVTSDLGHEQSSLSIWAWNQPEKVVDWGNRAIHLTTVVAKQVMNLYYRAQVQRAYFEGCSGGGREALMNASRFPADYDGIIAGAPGWEFSDIMSQQAWASQVYGSALLLPAKLPAVSAAVVKACDGLDGVEDGLIENPNKCTFDPASLKCGFLETGSCLIDSEIAALRKLYAGPTLNTGEVILPGFSKGGESNWFSAFLLGFAGGGPDYYKWIVYNNPLWTILNFNLDQDVPVSRARIEPIIDATPDIRAFTQRGGKLIMYHGWNDEIIPAGSGVRFIEQARALVGPTLSRNARLFMVPGAGHCEIGFDPVPLLENWVEHGQAPNKIVNATTASSGPVTRTLCPWPQTAVYNGTGPTSDAASFTCQTPR